MEVSSAIAYYLVLSDKFRRITKHSSDRHFAIISLSLLDRKMMCLHRWFIQLLLEEIKKWEISDARQYRAFTLCLRTA
jgi:hypothetical protein